MNALRRGISARELIQALRSGGFHLSRTRGSHRIYRHHDKRRVVVSCHRLSDTFPIKTLRAIIRDTGWTNDELRQLGLRVQ